MPDERPFIKSTVQYVGGIKDHYLDFEGKIPIQKLMIFLKYNGDAI